MMIFGINVGGSIWPLIMWFPTPLLIHCPTDLVRGEPVFDAHPSNSCREKGLSKSCMFFLSFRVLYFFYPCDHIHMIFKGRSEEHHNLFTALCLLSVIFVLKSHLHPQPNASCFICPVWVSVMFSVG